MKPFYVVYNPNLDMCFASFFADYEPSSFIEPNAVRRATTVGVNKTQLLSDAAQYEDSTEAWEVSTLLGLGWEARKVELT